MKLRHVLLLACAVGASGALLLAWDMHKRLKDAENELLLSGTGVSPVSASQPRADGPVGRAAGSLKLPPDEPTLSMLTVHALGLLSLAFLFLAILLLLISALREQAFALAIGGASTAKPAAPQSSIPLPAPHPALSPAGRGQGEGDALPVVMLLAEAAQQEETTIAREEGTGAAVRTAAVPAAQAGETPAVRPSEEQ